MAFRHLHSTGWIPSSSPAPVSPPLSRSLHKGIKTVGDEGIDGNRNSESFLLDINSDAMTTELRSVRAFEPPLIDMRGRHRAQAGESEGRFVAARYLRVVPQRIHASLLMTITSVIDLGIWVGNPYHVMLQFTCVLFWFIWKDLTVTKFCFLTDLDSVKTERHRGAKLANSNR